MTYTTRPFLGGGVVGSLVPFRIPCRWEPGVPVRRLVLTRYATLFVLVLGVHTPITEID